MPWSLAEMVVALPASRLPPLTCASVVLSTQFRLIWPATALPLDAPLPLAAMFVIFAALSASTVSEVSSFSLPIF